MGIIVGNSTHSQSSSSNTEGRRSTGQALVSVGVDLAENGQLDEALEVFQRALTTLSVDAGATKKDDHVNDGTTTANNQHETTSSAPSTATTRATSSEQDNNAVSSSTTSNHVPKPPPPPTSSCCKRLRQAHSLAKRGNVSTEKKRRMELANGTGAKVHGGNTSSSSSPSRRMNLGATKKSRRTKSAEEMAQAEIYREEVSEDSGTQNFSEPLRIGYQECALPECILSSPTALFSSSITCDAAIAAYNIAVTYELLGDSEEASLRSYKRCLSLLSKTNTTSITDHSESLLSSMALNNIAHILYHKDKLQESERHLMSAMRGTPQAFDSNGDIDTAAGQMDLAELMASTLASLAVGGESSLTNSSKAEASRRHVQAIILSNLGRVLFRFSRLTETLAVCLTISTIRKSLFGDSSHMAVAVIEYNIGLIKHKMGNSVEAKSHYENFLTTATLPIEAGGVGKGPGGRIIIAFARHQIGLLLSLFGQKEDAMRTLSEVLALRKSVYGDDHAEISKTLFSIAQIQFERGLHNQSLSTFNQVIQMARKVLPPNHMIFVFSLSYVAQIYRARGHTAEALIIYEKCYAVAIKAFGHNHYVVINIVNSIAQLQLSRGDYGQAAAAFGRASGLVVQTIVNTSSSNHGSVITRCQNKVAKSA